MKTFVCKSCKYYMAHYIFSNSAYHPIEGHCINDNIYHNRGKFEMRESCEFWESAKNEKEKRKESIKETLRHMQKNLADIADFLSKEE